MPVLWCLYWLHTGPSAHLFDDIGRNIGIYLACLLHLTTNIESQSMTLLVVQLIAWPGYFVTIQLFLHSRTRLLAHVRLVCDPSGCPGASQHLTASLTRSILSLACHWHFISFSIQRFRHKFQTVHYIFRQATGKPLLPRTASSWPSSLDAELHNIRYISTPIHSKASLTVQAYPNSSAPNFEEDIAPQRCATRIGSSSSAEITWGCAWQGGLRCLRHGMGRSGAGEHHGSGEEDDGGEHGAHI
jgi:hypothetical protein